MNTAEKSMLFRRLSLYLSAGVPIIQALMFIAEDSSSMAIRKILPIIEQSVATGQSLSSSMAQFPKYFDSFTIGFIYIGEISGNLSETLDRLALALHRKSLLTQKILSALIYPVIVLCGTIGITLFLLLFIFPKILPILRGFRTSLPFTTRILIAISSFLQHDWCAIPLFTAIIIGLTVSGWKYKKVRRISEKILLKIPLFGLLFQYYVLALFTRTMSLQLKSSVRILPALELTRISLPGTLYPDALEVVEIQILKGQRFSTALREHHILFPSLTCQMISAGETTGTLSINLETLADTYEENLDELARNLTVLIEPVLMVCMGLVVGFVALAIITPIYAVTQNLSAT